MPVRIGLLDFLSTYEIRVEVLIRYRQHGIPGYVLYKFEGNDKETVDSSEIVHPLGVGCFYRRTMFKLYLVCFYNRGYRRANA